jgi:hypothetical protein
MLKIRAYTHFQVLDLYFSSRFNYKNWGLTKENPHTNKPIFLVFDIGLDPRAKIERHINEENIKSYTSKF